MNLYVHFPFCRAKCSYCALNSRAGTSVDARDAYVRRIISEIPKDATFKTIYFGGGTPLTCNLNSIFSQLHFSDGYEFTVELHPLDATEENLKMLLAGGVNRISLGVQSFDDDALKLMRRSHSAADAAEAFKRIKAMFENCALDIIAGWPGTSTDSWLRTLDCAMALNPVHMSCYTLIREPKTLLDLSVRKGEMTLPDDDAALSQIELASKAFAECGLLRYEVSNYSKPGFECRHNCAVWNGEDYYGIGEGAHGRIALERTVGTARGYDRTPVCEREDEFERAVLSLRTARGLNLSRISSLYPIVAKHIDAWREILINLTSHGILTQNPNDVFTLTSRGYEVCDAVMAELSDEYSENETVQSPDVKQ